MQEEKTIVNLKFKSKLSAKELCEISKLKKEELKNTEGLISLICHYNEDTKMIGGTYIFKNILFARAYLGSFLINGLGPKYGVIPMTLKIDIAGIKDEIIGSLA